MNKSYIERIEKLKTIIHEETGIVMLCERTKIRDIEHFNKHSDPSEK